MRLAGRNLTFQMQGDDVAVLQRELRTLGFDIPNTEFAQRRLGDGTLKAVLEFQSARATATGIVDAATAAQLSAAIADRQAPSVPDVRAPQSIVRGRVRHSDGRPLAEGLVMADDRDLRSSQELNEGTTDADGRFEIAYAAGDFARAEKGSADLAFRLENRDGLPIRPFRLFRQQDGRSTAVEAPQIIFNASADETVDIVLGDGELRAPSEFERYLSELLPVMSGIPPADLREDDEFQDLTFLSRETGIEAQHINLLRQAHRLAQRGVPAAAFYGFFRQGLPTHLPALLAQSPQVLRYAIESAIAGNIVPAGLADDIDKVSSARS